MHNVVIAYVKKDGLMVPANESEAARLRLFNASLKEGAVVEVYLSETNDVDKTAGQLAKVHALIRELANFTGHTFNEMKDEIKKRAGLWKITGTRPEDRELKSFAECSKEELSAAIENCIELGNLLGYHVY